MKKIYLVFILAFLLIQTVLAVNLDIQKVTQNEVMIKGINTPTTFTINVTNNGPSDQFSFYTFFGAGMTPTEPIQINSSETKTVDLKIKPREDANLNGLVNFNYFVQESDKSEVKEKLTVNILELKDAFKVGGDSINPESNSVNVFLQNKINFDFKGLKFKGTSPFFDLDKVVDLAPYEKKVFKIELNKEDFSKLTAGFYTLSSDFEIDGVKAHNEESINFQEKSILKEERKDYGFIVSTTAINKINEGNTVQNSIISIKKSAISRMFTTFSPEPTSVVRDGFTVNYVWNKELGPGENYKVQVNTNWLIPFLIIILIVLTAVFARKYSKTDLVLRKRVAFINAKGGEFALKVMIHLEARKFIEDVKVFDRLPPLVKVYEKFGGVLPKRFNKTKKILEWELGDLEAGEKRMLSYVIYSKVGVLGKFALPSTYAMFSREGKPKEVNSNKAYFLADQLSE